MSCHPDERPRITFLFSDTGGGHRAAAEAIIEAVQAEYGDRVTTRMVDFLKDYVPPPFHLLRDIYPTLEKMPAFCGAVFEMSNGKALAHLVLRIFWPFTGHSFRRLVREHPSDILVGVHPLVNAFVLNAFDANHPQYITIVTDLVTPHALWYDRRSDLILAPTEMVRQNALDNGMPPGIVRVVGQPVSMRYRNASDDKHHLRTKLGWPQEKPTILLVGGGEGMGPLAETARAIDESGLDLSLVIIAGRNAKLEAALKQRTWNKPVFIYGFVRNMPDLMHASDILVTKAGPTTIAEALVANLPIILYAKLPGQENGNVDFVVNENVGVWAPKPAMVVRTLSRWLSDPGELQTVTANCRRVAQPDASLAIARIMGDRIGFTQASRDTAEVPFAGQVGNAAAGRRPEAQGKKRFKRRLKPGESLL